MLQRSLKAFGMKDNGINSLIVSPVNCYLFATVVISPILDQAKAVPPCPLSFRVPLKSPFLIVPIYGHLFKHLLPHEIILFPIAAITNYYEHSNLK